MNEVFALLKAAADGDGWEDVRCLALAKMLEAADRLALRLLEDVEDKHGATHPAAKKLAAMLQASDASDGFRGSQIAHAARWAKGAGQEL